MTEIRSIIINLVDQNEALSEKTLQPSEIISRSQLQHVELRQAESRYFRDFSKSFQHQIR